jgi:antitoxin component of MazEF toxin-antitoxin module
MSSHSTIIHAGQHPQQLQLSIPPAICQKLHLQPGQNVQWSVDHQGQIHLRCQVPAASDSAAEAKKGAGHC